MQREHLKWWSPSLNREMEVLAFGHGGTPILAFPSSLGRFFEWEDFGMVTALRDQLESGHNQLICVDSVDEESLYNKNVDPYTRIKRHQQYERYVLDEVMPFVRRRSNGDFVIAAGASFGAYHAVNFVLKQPWQFGKLIAMSGSFDVRSQFDGFYNDDVYFSNPVDYLPNLADAETLEAVRRNHIILTTADRDPCKEGNLHMSYLLTEKGIEHNVDFEHDAFGHDWPWWRRMIRKHVA
jgi:esterase/lipase superfamily enzyme